MTMTPEPKSKKIIPKVKFFLKLKDSENFNANLFLPSFSLKHKGYLVRSADQHIIDIWAGREVKIPLGFKSFCPTNYFFIAYPIDDLESKITCKFCEGEENLQTGELEDDYLLVRTTNSFQKDDPKIKISFTQSVAYLRLEYLQEMEAEIIE